MDHEAAATTRTPSLTIGLPNFGSYFGGDWQRLIEAARMAEDAGFDRLVINDHVVMGEHTDAYTWGRFPVPPDAPWLEPLTTLTAMAAATSTIRLGTSVLIAPLRPAALLAKTVATLDVLSSGRVDLGVGVGWQREEYAAIGADFDDRGQLLTDTMLACRELWTSMPASFSSATISFVDTYCAPQPIQQRLPVWFGGSLGARNLERITTNGDGWIVIMGASLDDIRHGCDQLHQIPDRRIQVQAPAPLTRDDSGAPDIPATMAAVPELLSVGVTDIYLNTQAFAPAGADLSPILHALRRCFDAAIR